MHNKLQLLHEFLNEVTHTQNENDLSQLFENYKDKLDLQSEEDMLYQLLQDAQSFGREMLLLKSNGTAQSRKIASLSQEEKTELAEVEKIIDENRFCYHFQPIVNTLDGDIYSYEALMRPKSDMRLSPFHILKYAELLGRLHDIELATFLNVLNIIDSDKPKFHNRRVFINSIPKIMLNGNDFRRVGELLMKHSDTAVVELTEYAESDEAELNVLKERYMNMGIKIAIDDYGTGYSNVNNLLRYMPDYVKIDRSLISDIQNNSKKRHFVREIIEFCHGTGIMALAEGVETSEELRAVILLGADLIQGYYTAKPNAEIIDSIPYEIRQEIRLCQQERQDGKDQQVYFAEPRERILLERLVQNGYKCIFIGRDNTEENKVTIIGSPSLNTEIHIEVTKNFNGKLILENVHLSNIKNRPCIELSENSNVTISFNGENKLDKSGIRVPETTKLTLEGDGVLNINIDAAEYFCIGNDISSGHGDLIFNHSGIITISARGRRGVCIGSGLGGNIKLSQGKCVLHVSGYTGVGIGSLYADSKIDICNCAIDTDISFRKGVIIGSLTGSTDIHIWQSSSQLYLSGEELTAIGTISGDNAAIRINDAITAINLRGVCCTCIGSLEESTSCSIETATLRATVGGDKALPFGSFSGKTKVSLYTSDTNIKMETNANVEKYLSPKHIQINQGRVFFSNHGNEITLKSE